MSEVMEELGTMEEAARLLGVSVKTIRRRIADGSITAYKYGPRLIRVDMRSLNNCRRSLTWAGSL